MSERCVKTPRPRLLRVSERTRRKEATVERNEHVDPFQSQTERAETVPTESSEFIEIRLLDKIETIESKAVAR